MGTNAHSENPQSLEDMDNKTENTVENAEETAKNTEKVQDANQGSGDVSQSEETNDANAD